MQGFERRGVGDCEVFDPSAGLFGGGLSGARLLLTWMPIGQKF